MSHAELRQKPHGTTHNHFMHVLFHLLSAMTHFFFLLLLLLFFPPILALNRNQIDKRTILENLDYMLLIVDELIDEGYATIPSSWLFPFHNSYIYINLLNIFFFFCFIFFHSFKYHIGVWCESDRWASGHEGGRRRGRLIGSHQRANTSQGNAGRQRHLHWMNHHTCPSPHSASSSSSLPRPPSIFSLQKQPEIK